MKIRLRRAEWDDCELLLSWANDPLTRRMSFDSSPIPLDTHQRWFAAKLRDPRCQLYIALDEAGVALGQVRFDLEEEGSAVVSLALAPSRRGQGFASPVLEVALAQLGKTSGAGRVLAYIRPENTASLRAFEAAGFGRHQIFERNGERRIRLERRVGPAGLAGYSRRLASGQLERLSAEFRGEAPLTRARAIIDLARSRGAAKGTTPEARAVAYRRLVAEHPRYFRTHSFLGHALLSSQQPREAAKVFEAALPLAPGNRGLLDGLSKSTLQLEAALPAVVVNAMETNRRTRLETLEKALALARRHGSSDSAERLARRLVSLYPFGSTPKGEDRALWRALATEFLENRTLERPIVWALDGQRDRVHAPAPKAPPASAAPALPRAVAPVDVVEILSRIEQTLPVAEWSVNGVSIWPVLRTQIGARLLSLTQGVAPGFPNKAAPTNMAKKREGSLLAELQRQRLHLSALRRSDTLFVGLTAQRQLHRGRWHDRLFDPIRGLIDQSGLTSLQLDSIWNTLDATAIQARASVAFQPLLDDLMRSMPRLPVWQLAFADWDALPRMLAEYVEPLDSPLWLERTPDRYAQWLTAIFKAADYFDLVLSRVRPRAVFLTVYYSVFGFALCLAAARRGIPAIDVQHGMTTRHYAYEAWSNPPRAGYPVLPSVFWSWTERDADRISSWSSSTSRYHRAVVGGHPWMIHSARVDQRDEASVRRVRALRGQRLTVLITLNWSSGFDDVFKRLLETSGPETTWWIRLHPAMRSQLEEVTTWCRENVRAPHQVEAVTDVALTTVLEACDVHLTLSSSVTQEATRSGVPSVCLEARSRWLYAAEIESGWVQCVSGGPAEVSRALFEQAERAKTLARWAPFPGRERMESALWEILEMKF